MAKPTIEAHPQRMRFLGFLGWILFSLTVVGIFTLYTANKAVRFALQQPREVEMCIDTYNKVHDEADQVFFNLLGKDEFISPLAASQSAVPTATPRPQSKR